MDQFRVLILAFSIPLAGARADSNIRPDQSAAWGANIGWTQWRPDSTNGVRVDEFVCSGYIYAANAGWIRVGNGLPANGIRYQNDSATDFGVNMDAEGNLRGLAYGANIGWINFETAGAPRVDLRTGRFSGFAYGANIGWINLSDTTHFLQADSIAPGSDQDNDGIPDGWEITYAGNLSTLSGSADRDGDGHTDLQEYLADTNPTQANDRLRIVEWSVSPEGLATQLTWTSRPTRHYLIEVRRRFEPDSGWADSGFGLLPASGAITRQTLTNRVGTDQLFFRIQAVRPLSGGME